MNRILPLTIVALAILAFATVLLVIVPGMQIRSDPPTPGLAPYTAQELRGRAVYVSNGCVYCHSQQPRSIDQAPDVERGWGRAAVASDFVYDRPHQLGTMRTGPDLLNVGARLPSRDWQLAHLYQPRSISPWSIMPAYPYLFEIKQRAEPGDIVVNVPAPYAPQNGVVVAKREALDLTAYLVGLDRTMPVPPKALRDDGYAAQEKAQ